MKLSKKEAVYLGRLPFLPLTHLSPTVCVRARKEQPFYEGF